MVKIWAEVGEDWGITLDGESFFAPCGIIEDVEELRWDGEHTVISTKKNCKVITIERHGVPTPVLVCSDKSESEVKRILEEYEVEIF